MSNSPKLPAKPKVSPLVRRSLMAGALVGCSGAQDRALPPQVYDPPPQPMEGEGEVEPQPDVDAGLTPIEVPDDPPQIDQSYRDDVEPPAEISADVDHREAPQVPPPEARVIDSKRKHESQPPQIPPKDKPPILDPGALE